MIGILVVGQTDSPPTDPAVELGCPAVGERYRDYRRVELQEVTAGFRPVSASGDATPWTRPDLSVSPTPSAPAARSGHRLVGAAGNRCLDIAAPDSSDPVRLQLADCRDDRTRNQLWTMKPDGSVQLGGRCLDVLGASSDAGAAIQLTTCTTTPAQRFTLDGNQHLVNAHGGMCLGAVGQSTASGALIEQRSCGAGTNHLR
ncbi:RICIN domain-containing protein [Micromonospora sp. NPDC005203]|uniref:RICIN domain-containing protein n=1 Tax=Micromonospora sp. NPDC005203 TaxID=3364226 RepID=UPI0036AC6DAC